MVIAALRKLTDKSVMPGADKAVMMMVCLGAGTPTAHRHATARRTRASSALIGGQRLGRVTAREDTHRKNAHQVEPDPERLSHVRIVEQSLPSRCAVVLRGSSMQTR